MAPIPWGWSIGISYVEFFCMRLTSISPIYLMFIYLYQYGSQIFILYFGYSSIQFISFVSLKLLPLWPLGGFSLACHVTLTTSLLSSPIKCSNIILYIPFLSPKINHFFRKPRFLYWRLALEIKTWLWSLLTVLGTSMLLDPLSWESKYMCVIVSFGVRVKLAS